jgi:ribosomal protein S18 acetylase RimI-like enzyme
MSSLIFREYLHADNIFVSDALYELEKIERDAITSLKIDDDFNQKISLWITQLHSTPSNLIIMAEINQQVCGFIIAIVEVQNNQFTQYKTHGLIQAIWVEPGQRQKGIGKALVKQALDSFAEFRIPYCDIAFHPDNKTAKTFWEKMGFNKAQVTARKFLLQKL